MPDSLSWHLNRKSEGRKEIVVNKPLIATFYFLNNF
jgi:hypothetical protein